MEKLCFHNNTVDLNSIWYTSHKDLLERLAVELGAADKIDSLIDKFLGAQTKFKKQKDPLAPKRPRSAFIYFCNDLRADITSKFPDLRLGGIQKELSKIWQSYDDKQKEKYHLQNSEDKMRYEEELEQYNLNKNFF